MQYVELKVVSKKFINMGGGDPQKQIEERAAALEQIRKDAEARERSGQYAYQASWNPFPKWVHDVIKTVAGVHKTKARFDDENSVIKVKIEGGRQEYDEFYEKFQKAYATAAGSAPENQAWFEENHVHMTSTPDDELGAMNDLELYQRNAAALPPSRNTASETNK